MIDFIIHHFWMERETHANWSFTITSFVSFSHIFIIRLTCLVVLLPLYRHQIAPHMTCLDKTQLRNIRYLENIWCHQSAHLDLGFLFVAALKDTHSGCGGDGCNGAYWDRFLGVTQVARAVGAGHDACEKRKKR